ncbi:hypothetical protein EVAR_2552_1 [Eumeta japonica]|uniref:Uncharacterized protein n=1 Tax=Eumeta variegata TaxID=151549 RepID=A0A4C1SRP5_EUMVA|nr:hypothetical protein EVAR_2552_1 [Eumeta japonica]
MSVLKGIKACAGKKIPLDEAAGVKRTETGWKTDLRSLFITNRERARWKTWAGHIARMSDDRLTKRTTSWRGPDGKRSIGRPCARWSDDVMGVAGNWLEERNNKEK